MDKQITKNTDNNNNILKDLPWMAIAAVSGIIFITIFCALSSPAYSNYYGNDNAFFTVMGKSVLHGKLLYTDYIDVKGPLFFFYEAFGQIFGYNRMGVYICECLCMIGTTGFLYKMCKLYDMGAGLTVLVFALFYLAYSGSIWGGNTPEEFILPFLLGTLYFGIRYLKGKNDDLKVAIFMGFTFAACIFSKMTMSATVGAVALVVIVVLISRRQFKELGLCTVYFILGMAIVTVPLFIYFGINGGLQNMLDCCFGYAFKRAVAQNYGVSSIFADLSDNSRAIYRSPALGGFLLFGFRITEKGHDKWLLLLESVLGFVFMSFGSPYIYYFIVMLPLYVHIVLMLIVDIREYVRQKGKNFWKGMLADLSFYVSILAIVLTCYAFLKSLSVHMELYSNIYNNHIYDGMVDDYNFMLDRIPEAERDDIYSVGAPMAFYEVTDTLPSNRCPSNYWYFVTVDDKLEQETFDDITNHKSKWLVTSCFYLEGINEIGDEPDALAQLVSENYVLDAYTNSGYLWRAP